MRRWRTVTYWFCVLLILSLLALPVSHLAAQSGVTDFTTVRVTDFFRAQPRAPIIVTNGATINPRGSIQPLTSGGAVGTAGTDITIKPSGSLVTLVNVGASTITITETGVFTSAGNIVLGAGDSVTLYSNGSAWIQTGASNN